MMLAALLLLLSGSAARGRLCPWNQLKMTTSAIERTYYEWETYGKNITVTCFAENTTNLQLTVNGKLQQIYEVNSTTVQFCADKPHVGIYTYSCVDSVNGCEDSVGIYVKPAMSVESTRVLHKLDDGWQHYLVRLGEDYEVTCSGHDSSSLTIYSPNRRPLPPFSVNSTTITYKTRADHLIEELRWHCQYSGTSVVKKTIFVKVDYYPKCEDFQCFIRDWKILECSWRYPSNSFTFGLFYTDHENDDNAATPTPLCFDMPGEVNNNCTRDIKSKGFKSFTIHQIFYLLLKTCNLQFCNNETFNFNIHSLIKLDTILGLKVLDATPLGALLQWNRAQVRISSADFGGWNKISCDTCVYKVDFRLKSFGDVWRQVNTSSIRYDGDYIEFVLTLPYPNSLYEVLVYTRHEDATEDRVWSDPASVFVHTNQREKCACDAAPRTTKPTVSSEKISYPADASTFPKSHPQYDTAGRQPRVYTRAMSEKGMLQPLPPFEEEQRKTPSQRASCRACKLTEDAINESLSLKNKIKYSLKKKLAKAKEMSELLFRSKEIADRFKTLG